MNKPSRDMDSTIIMGCETDCQLPNFNASRNQPERRTSQMVTTCRYVHGPHALPVADPAVLML